MGGSGLDQINDFQKFCRSGLDQIQFFWTRIGLALKNFIVRLSVQGSVVQILKFDNLI